MYGMGEGRTSIRVLGAGSPMTLSLRPLPEPGSRDPLRGREVWHTVTDTTVLAGLRSPAGAVRLLDQLRCPTLTRMRQRLSAAARDTAHSNAHNTAHNPGHDAAGEPSAAATALSSLLQWPYRARTSLVHDVTCAVDAVFSSSLMTDRPEVSRTLGWVLALTLAHPGDPLALAPVLLRARRLPAGTSFVLPAGWPFLRLTGAAVGIATSIGAGDQGLLRATIGGDHGDVAGLVSALERQPARTGHPLPPPPGSPAVNAVTPDDALQQALQVARQVSALHPQLAGSPDVVDLRHTDRAAGPRIPALSRLASTIAPRGIG